MARIDPRELRDVLGNFVTGVTVVTTLDGEGQPRGFTANSFTSVSLDPPLVLVCIAKDASTFEHFRSASGYAVNILAESQRELSGHFASRRDDKFDGVSWFRGPAGNPLLPGVVAWLDCTLHQQVDAGDHLVLIGRVEALDHTALSPLGYCRGAYVDFALEVEAVAAGTGLLRVGAIIEWERSVLLVRDSAGLAIPTGRAIGSPSDPKSLRGRLSDLGVEADLGFLYAVVEAAGGDTLSIFYRGIAEDGSVRQPGEYHDLDAIPWHGLHDSRTTAMLQRYVRERAEDQFGVYVGDDVSGTVRPLGQD